MGEDKNSTDESFIDSIKQVLYSRIKSRFTGAFILSWFVSNWQIFYFTIFVNKTEIDITKLDYVTEHFLESSNILWWPLAGALVITLIAPLINGLANNWNEYSSLVVKSISLKIAKKTPVDRLEYESLIEKFNEFEILKIREIQKLKDDFSEEKQRLEASINILSEENDILKSQVTSLHKANPKTSNISDERILNRLKLDLKGVLNEKLIQLGPVINPLIFDRNEIKTSSVLLKELDSISGVFSNVLKSRDIKNHESIMNLLNDQLYKFEDNINEITKLMVSIRAISVEDRISQLQEIFAPIYEVINSIQAPKEDK